VALHIPDRMRVYDERDRVGCEQRDAVDQGCVRLASGRAVGTRRARRAGTANSIQGEESIVLPDFWEYPALRVLQLAIAILAIVIALATAI
jgi:hypothetical protein